MIDILTETALFRDIDELKFNELIRKSPPQTLTFKRGDKVFPINEYEAGIGIIVEGKCDICRTHCNGGRTIINSITKKDTFGVLSVFSQEDFPTEIYANVNTEIAFFTKKQVLNLIEICPTFSLNLINFLVNRVVFLNQKVATFSIGSVDARLASYLLYESSTNNSLTFTLNYKKTAEKINSARASVYRAIDSLENEGYIKADGKEITILNKTALERISK